MAMLEICEIENQWIESNKKKIALLVLLEYSYPEIVDLISNSKITEEDLLVTVEYALDFESRHWAEKAVAWIELGLDINQDIYYKLRDISTNKRDSQNLRHRSTKQANKWGRANGI
jgi:hypothetical protein